MNIELEFWHRVVIVAVALAAVVGAFVVWPTTMGWILMACVALGTFGVAVAVLATLWDDNSKYYY
jgi:hypothetical protein